MSKIWWIIGLIFALGSGCLSLMHPLRWTPKFSKGKFGAKKLETSVYCIVWNILHYLEPFRHDSRVWQTDRQTDRLAHSICHASLQLQLTFPSAEHHWSLTATTLYCLATNTHDTSTLYCLETEVHISEYWNKNGRKPTSVDVNLQHHLLTMKWQSLVRWLMPAQRNPPCSKRHQLSRTSYSNQRRTITIHHLYSYKFMVDYRQNIHIQYDMHSNQMQL